MLFEGLLQIRFPFGDGAVQIAICCESERLVVFVMLSWQDHGHRGAPESKCRDCAGPNAACEIFKYPCARPTKGASCADAVIGDGATPTPLSIK